MDLPADVENRHDVFTFAIDEKLTAHVPALALMRAFFKPHHCVLSAVFCPTSLDALSFVDYCQDPPVVVLDNVPERGKRFAPKAGAHRECSPGVRDSVVPALVLRERDDLERLPQRFGWESGNDLAHRSDKDHSAWCA